MVRRNHPRLEFQLVFAGDASTDRGLARLLKRVQRTLPVNLLPYTSDSDAAILTAQARGFLYPSLWEGFGIPPLEAMSAGTLTVVGDVSSMPEVSGPCAIYCDPYDVHEMADAFYQALTMDDKRRKRRIADAREHAAQFAWTRTAKKLLSVIDEELSSDQRTTRDYRSARQGISQCA
jgi:glycosyltransferase involved in cell wall biosynthesis